MIAVIADDFTGAAEIGGVGIKYGRSVVIETRVNSVNNTDLLVIAADTRTLSEEEASKEIERITEKLLQLKPNYIFKKLDSALRGNIAAEIKAQMFIAGKKRAILVAGNPSFGRTIEKGTYYIDGIPLSETSFADDPDFPVRSSIVTDIIKSDDLEIQSCSVGERIPKSGIIVGDVRDQEEMDAWVKIIDKEIVVAGGAGFFDVLMSKEYTSVQQNFAGCLKLGPNTLFIFGSKYPKADSLPLGLKEKDTVRLNMPDEIYGNAEFEYQLLIDWAEQVIENFNSKKNVILTVDQDYSAEANIAERIRKNVAQLVKLVSQGVELTDLFIEGGATTSEILKAIGITKLYPNRLVHQGIIQMEAKEFPNLTITTKPGSYPWPDNVVLSEKCRGETFNVE